MAQQVAEKVGIGKRAVNMRLNEASAAIGEKIDLYRDTPEELERKADKRLRAEPKPKVERPKRRKPATRAGIEDRTPPAEPEAAEVGRQIEDLWKAFDAIGRRDQLRFVHDACLRLGLQPLKMAPVAAFGLVEEEPELAVDSPAELAPATDDAAVAQAEQREDAADLGAEDLQVADDDASEDADYAAADDADDDVSEAADQEDLGAEDLEDAGDDGFEAADQEPGGAMKCAYCNIEFENGDQLEEFEGQLYHGFCVEDGKRLAAKRGKQIAIAAE